MRDKLPQLSLKPIIFLVLFLGSLHTCLLGQNNHVSGRQYKTVERPSDTRENEPSPKPQDEVIANHFKGEEIPMPAVINRFNKAFVSRVGGSASGLIGRVSGADIQGSMVSFRGLSPRYTTFTLNGISTPITQQNIKAFSLGLLPSATVQSMDVYKSGHFSNYGEWGGANVNIYSSADIPKNYTKVSFGLTFQNRFTFSDFVKDEEHGSSFGDYFGYGVDRRKFQNEIVDAPTLQSLDRAGSAGEGAKLPNTWPLEVVTAGPGYNLGFSFGRILKEDGDFKLATANSVVYRRMQGGLHRNQARWEDYQTDENGEVIQADLTSFMTDGIFSDDAKIQLHTDWFLRVDDDHEFDASLIYSNQGTNTTLSRYFVSLGRQIDVYGAQYGLLAKSMFLGRFTGSHEFFVDTDVDWSIGFGIFNRDEPDLKRTGAQRNLADTNLPYLLIIPESSKADNGARFASDMDDDTFGARVDIDHDFIDDVLELKVGLMYDRVSRDFGARLITGAKDDFTNPELRIRPARDLPVVWASENFTRPDGYFLVDGTTPFESYTASNDLFAAYVGLDWSITENFAVSVGGRFENFTQKLDSRYHCGG